MAARSPALSWGKLSLPRQRVGLVKTLLTGKALSWFAPLFKKRSSILNNFESFLEAFVEVLGEHDKAWWATTKIQSRSGANSRMRIKMTRAKTESYQLFNVAATLVPKLLDGCGTRWVPTYPTAVGVERVCLKKALGFWLSLITQASPKYKGMKFQYI